MELCLETGLCSTGLNFCIGGIRGTPLVSPFFDGMCTSGCGLGGPGGDEEAPGIRSFIVAGFGRAASSALALQSAQMK